MQLNITLFRGMQLNSNELNGIKLIYFGGKFNLSKTEIIDFKESTEFKRIKRNSIKSNPIY